MKYVIHKLFSFTIYFYLFDEVFSGCFYLKERISCWSSNIKLQTVDVDIPAFLWFKIILNKFFFKFFPCLLKRFCFIKIFLSLPFHRWQCITWCKFYLWNIGGNCNSHYFDFKYKIKNMIYIIHIIKIFILKKIVFNFLTFFVLNKQLVCLV